jgi:hypothetical protein
LTGALKFQRRAADRFGVQSAIPGMVFEALPAQRMVVVWAGKGELSPDEWDRCLASIRSLGDLKGLRLWVWSEGARPSRAQQAELIELTRDADVRAALVSPSVAMRFVVSVFTLVYRDIRLFAPAQLEEAIVQLCESGEEAEVVRAAVERVKQAFERAQTDGPSVSRKNTGPIHKDRESVR